MIKHYFEFVTTQRGIIQVDEPVGFDKVGFTLKQDDGRKGRDVSSSGNSEAKYKMVWYVQNLGYALNEFNLEFSRFGDQANVIYHQDLGEGRVAFGNVDMQTFIQFNDRVEFVIIALSAESEYKTTFDLPTNLFSPNDLKGNPITPCQTVRVFVPAKPIYQESKWSTPQPMIGQIGASALKTSNTTQINNFGLNSAISLDTYEIEESYTNIFNRTGLDNNGLPTDETRLGFVKAKDNINNFNIYLKNIQFSAYTSKNDLNPQPVILNASGFSRLIIRKGFSLNESQLFVLSQVNFTNNEADNTRKTITGDFTLNVGLLKRNEYIWIYIENKINITFGNSGSLLATYNIVNDFTNMDVVINGSSLTFNRVVETIRYINAIKYAVKSASQLEVSAPMYEAGGEDYSQFITNAQLMRGLLNRPFNISNKDIIEHIRAEKNGDFEVTPTPSIFIGKYKDFYRDEEIGFYDRLIREDDSIETNDRYSFNKFNIEYKNYAAQKEVSSGNTLDTVHGKAVFTTPKLRVNNSREASINFIRDAILWQQYINKANVLKDSEATQDDDKIFIVDCIANTGGNVINENAPFEHQGNGNTLILKNDGSFNFIGLGIEPTRQFSITSIENMGVYNVSIVTPRQITMFRTDGVPVISYAEINTSFTYTISEINVPYKARTNEGFSVFTNLETQGAINTRFTLARIMYDSYQEELATNLLYSNGLPIRNASYDYNPTATTKYLDNPVIIEGANQTHTGALVNGKIHNLKLVLNYAEYMQMITGIRTESGYIRTNGLNGIDVKGYIKNIEWQPVSKSVDDLELFYGEADVTLEEKYSEFDIYIFTLNDTVIINETIQPDGITWYIDEYGYVTFYDLVGMQLEVKVLFDRVKINNSQKASNAVELGRWLSLIQQ